MLTVISRNRVINDGLYIGEELYVMIIDRVDGIAWMQASKSSWGASNDFADDRRVGWFTKAIGDGEEHHCQDNIHGDASDQHYDAFASGFSGKTLGVVSTIYV